MELEEDELKYELWMVRHELQVLEIEEQFKALQQRSRDRMKCFPSHNICQDPLEKLLVSKGKLEASSKVDSRQMRWHHAMIRLFHNHS